MQQQTVSVRVTAFNFPLRETGTAHRGNILEIHSHMIIYNTGSGQSSMDKGKLTVTTHSRVVEHLLTFDDRSHVILIIIKISDIPFKQHYNINELQP